MFLLSILNLVISYYLALRKYQLSIIIALGIGVVGWLMLMHHASLQAVVSNLVIGSTTTLALFAVWRCIPLLQHNKEAR